MTEALPTGPDTTPAAPARVKRSRSATESLLSIVLLLEAILVFFVTLAAFGLRVVPAGFAFGGGAVLFIVLLLVGRIVRYPSGLALGWLMQAMLILLGLVLSLMYFIGAIFLGIWIYCFIVGRRLDRRTAPTITPQENL